MDVNGCPADYEELARNYLGMIRKVVQQQGVPAQDADDVAQDLLLKFYARDTSDGDQLGPLRAYDPAKLFDTPSGPRSAKFPTLLRSFVRKYARTPAEKLKKIRDREPLTDVSDKPDAWVEVYGRGIDESLEQVEDRVEFERAFQLLGSVRLSDDVTAADVFGVLVEVGTEQGEPAPGAEIAKRLGVSDTVALEWRRRVYDELETIGFMAA